MEWLDRLTESLDYIEEHLDGEIELEQAAQIACCSTFHFQRMFGYIAGTPLSEYIRRRRMSRAAVDLHGGAKVLETALRYGYESPTAFSRAFASVHGIPPSAAQKPGAPLKAYNRISFTITIKGDTQMDYRMENKEAFRVVGLREPMSKQMEENFSTIPNLWARAAETHALERLCGVMDGSPQGVLGVSACPPTGDWFYYIGVVSSLPLPEELPGVCEYHVPAQTWAVFPGRGAMPDAIQQLEKQVLTEWLPTSGYEYADGPDVEVYLDANLADAKFEVWIPVRRK